MLVEFSSPDRAQQDCVSFGVVLTYQNLSSILDK